MYDVGASGFPSAADDNTPLATPLHALELQIEGVHLGIEYVRQPQASCGVKVQREHNEASAGVEVLK